MGHLLNPSCVCSEYGCKTRITQVVQALVRRYTTTMYFNWRSNGRTFEHLTARVCNLGCGEDFFQVYVMPIQHMTRSGYLKGQRSSSIRPRLKLPFPLHCQRVRSMHRLLLTCCCRRCLHIHHHFLDSLEETLYVQYCKVLLLYGYV